MNKYKEKIDFYRRYLIGDVWKRYEKQITHLSTNNMCGNSVLLPVKRRKVLKDATGKTVFRGKAEQGERFLSLWKVGAAVLENNKEYQSWQPTPFIKAQEREKQLLKMPDRKIIELYNALVEREDAFLFDSYGSVTARIPHPKLPAVFTLLRKLKIEWEGTVAFNEEKNYYEAYRKNKNGKEVRMAYAYRPDSLVSEVIRKLGK